MLGAILTLLLAGLTVFVFAYSGKSFFPVRSGDLVSGESFHQKLQNFDEFFARNFSALSPFSPSSPSALSPSVEELNRRLDALEKDALGTESHLSVLKRRRALSLNGFPGSWAAYLDASERVAAKFPHADAILAVAAEAAARSGSPEKALEYAGSITSGSLLPLVFGAAALAGALETPEKAAALGRSGELLLSVKDSDPVRDRDGFTIDAAIVRILKGDIRGAGELIRLLPDSGSDTAARKALNFTAEYHYDFGDLKRAAEIFAELNDETSLAREADALALAGEIEPARALWLVLSSPDENGIIITPPDILIRSLYNLAAAAETPEEELILIQRVLSINPNHLYALIRYTRLLPTERALAILDNSDIIQTEPLIGLESLKRHRENWPVEKVVPETWLLLNRHNASAHPAFLYRWGCYYFDFQKQYGETARLIRSAERHGIGGPWLDFHRALALIRQNNLTEGEALLLTIEEKYGQGGKREESGIGDPAIITGTTVKSSFWHIPANLGRIREAAHSFQTALDYYETAANRVRGNADAARIYYRIARCLRSLGRDREARDTLERGLSLDSENLPIRLELTRLNDLGIF
jgi:tetratricopeptide (TPR) repeat protein